MSATDTNLLIETSFLTAWSPVRAQGTASDKSVRSQFRLSEDRTPNNSHDLRAVVKIDVVPNRDFSFGILARAGERKGLAIWLGGLSNRAEASFNLETGIQELQELPGITGT